MLNSARWCIEKNAESNSYRLTRFLFSKNGRKHFSKIIETDTPKKFCRGKLSYTFCPEEYYLFSDVFPKLKKELLDLQINKRFRNLGLVMEPDEFLQKSRENPNDPGKHHCLFVQKKDILPSLQELASWHKVKTAELHPLASSLAGLLGTLTEKAVLCLFFGGNSSQLLAVKAGIPLYSQSLAQAGPGQVEEALIPNAVDFARHALRKDHDIQDSSIVCLGVRRHSVQLQNLGIDQWHPDFSSIIDAPEEDVLNYPQLFGTVFSAPEFDFLPGEFHRSWQLQSISRTVTIMALLAAAGIFGWWWFGLKANLESRQLEFNRRTKIIREKEGVLSKKLPKQDILNNFERLVDIRWNYHKDFRLDRLVSDLARALPQKVQIRQIRLLREAGQNPAFTDPDNPGSDNPASPDNGSTAEQLQARPVTVALICNTEGSYPEVTVRFEKTVASLNSFFVVDNTTWNYSEEQGSGQLNCELAFPVQEDR